jgi:hypothetical protein
MKLTQLKKDIEFAQCSLDKLISLMRKAKPINYWGINVSTTPEYILNRFSENASNTWVALRNMAFIYGDKRLLNYIEKIKKGLVVERLDVCDVIKSGDNLYINRIEFNKQDQKKLFMLLASDLGYIIEE